MKKCPFCAEEIQDEAIKCKHCGEFLNGSGPPPIPGNRLPWYFRTTAIVLVVLSIPPMALPMVLLHPTMAKGRKIGWVAIILVLSWLMYVSIVATLGAFAEIQQTMQSL